MARYVGQLKYCYELELREDPTVAGGVEVGWTVTAGKVSAATELTNTTGNPGLSSCVVNKIKRWQFDPAFSGEVRWPFAFSPKE